MAQGFGKQTGGAAPKGAGTVEVSLPGRAKIDAAKLASEVARLETKAREDRSERRSPKAGGRL